MTAPAAAIAGSLVDAKNIATHKSFRLIIDIPAEQAMQAIEAFGWPTMVNPVAVAVARLNTGKEVVPNRESQSSQPRTNKTGVSGVKRQWADMPLAQQIGIRCNEQAFQRFLREEGESNVADADTAATYVRLICGVKSRADIALSGPARAAWDDLNTRYQVWLSDPVGAAE